MRWCFAGQSNRIKVLMIRLVAFWSMENTPKRHKKREFKEETGLDIEPKEILGIYMVAQEDIASLHWVDINDLP